MSYKKIYKSPCISSMHTLEYVKNNLKHMRNIVEFKAFKDCGHEYYDIINDTKCYYNLILSDDDYGEFWLYSNYGYNGTGPMTTCEILELVGLREDYGIFSNEKVHESDLEPNYDLNILVVEFNNLEEYKIDFLDEIKFSYAYDRYKFVESLKVLGNVYNLNIQDDRFNKYFVNSSIEQGYGEYGVNQILFLDKPLQNINSKNIKSIIENIVNKHCKSVNTLNINCVFKDN